MKKVKIIATCLLLIGWLTLAANAADNVGVTISIAPYDYETNSSVYLNVTVRNHRVKAFTSLIECAKMKE
jgi:hypothetical protein